MISVRLESVVTRFGNRRALKGLSLDVQPGELMCILGPGGSGKTSLLRTLAGDISPESGRIFFADQEVTSLAPVKRKVGSLFQGHALWPQLTVGDNVAHGLKQQRLKKATVRERVAESLASVRMTGGELRRVNELSGGELQRVALARALATRPQCLLLDEPLANLGANLRRELRAEIRRICKGSGITTIYVTHDQKEALSIADRIAVLDKGRVLQVGAPAEIYRRPQNRSVAEFIGEANFFDGTVTREGAGFVSVETALGELQGVAGDPETAYAEGARVVVLIRPERFRLDRFPADENSIPGTIGDSTYYGETAQYVFHSADGGELKLAELNPRHVYKPQTEGLYAYVDPEDVVVLPA